MIICKYKKYNHHKNPKLIVKNIFTKGEDYVLLLDDLIRKKQFNDFCN